ncbi:MAG: hypothetical protein ACOYED_06020 [Peptococcia bacterium]|jgi:hypothetical protein
MARLPWRRPEERKEAENRLKNGSVFGIVRNGFMELPQNREVEEERYAPQSELILEGRQSRQSVEIDKGVNGGSRTVEDFLAAAKANKNKEQQVSIVNTPNEEIVITSRARTPRMKVPGYTEKVMLDGSIISTKDKGVNGGSRTVEDFLAAAKANKNKEQQVSIVNTPNEEIVITSRTRTPRMKVPGYTEKVMPDGSIISVKEQSIAGRKLPNDISEQSKAQGVKPVRQVRTNDDREFC